MPQKRKYNVDDNFFDVIDTEAKAYILGLLCADGYLMKNGNSTGVGIDLNYKDTYLLEMIKREMRFEGNINPTNHGMRRIKITSSALYSRLESIGFSLRKSYDLSDLKVHIPERLYNHFFRGYFDGDGSFSFEKSTLQGGRYTYYRNRVYIRGTKAFLKYIQTMCPISFSEKYSKTQVLYLSDRDLVLRFRNWMYKDAVIYLLRKYSVIPNTECAIPGNRNKQIYSNRLETPPAMEGNKGEAVQAP